MQHHKTIYVDVRKSFSFTESGKYNGGNNYTRRLVQELLKRENSGEELQVKLICCEKSRDVISSLFLTKIGNIISLNGIHELKINAEDIYFCPHINDSLKYAKELETFRRNNPQTTTRRSKNTSQACSLWTKSNQKSQS